MFNRNNNFNKQGFNRGPQANNGNVPPRQNFNVPPQPQTNQNIPPMNNNMGPQANVPPQNNVPPMNNGRPQNNVPPQNNIPQTNNMSHSLTPEQVHAAHMQLKKRTKNALDASKRVTKAAMEGKMPKIKGNPNPAFHKIPVTVRWRKDTDPNYTVDDNQISTRAVNHTRSLLNILDSTALRNAITSEISMDQPNRRKVLHELMYSQSFIGNPSYHNKGAAELMENEIVGLGVITRLIHAHPNITDIAYNGTFMTYETNNGKYIYGQHPRENPELINSAYVDRLLNRFTTGENNHASLNASNPIFDGILGYMRIAADDESMTPNGVGPTFALRFSKPHLALNLRNVDGMMPKEIYYNLLVPMIKAHANILISGETGTGKTELQKLLIGNIDFRERVIMIEDTPETHLKHLYPDKDIMDWITSHKNAMDKTNKNLVTISDHIKASLRNNPKWIIVSETRGGEAYDMFQSVLTGHSIITTMHATDNRAVPSRFMGMILKAVPNIDIHQTMKDFLTYFTLGIHIRRKDIFGQVVRYIDNISEFVPKSRDYPDGVRTIFQQRIDNRGYRYYKTMGVSKALQHMTFVETDSHIHLPKHVGKHIPEPHLDRSFDPNTSNGKLTKQDKSNQSKQDNAADSSDEFGDEDSDDTSDSSNPSPTKSVPKPQN